MKYKFKKSLKHFFDCNDKALVMEELRESQVVDKLLDSIKERLQTTDLKTYTKSIKVLSKLNVNLQVYHFDNALTLDKKSPTKTNQQSIT